jgi:hypothetical protein
VTQPAQASKASSGMRVYRWPPGSTASIAEFEVVGVTSIISNGIPKPFLEGWAAKMTALCAVDDHDLVTAMLAKKGGERMAIDHLKGARYRDKGAKADRGTIVHAAIEAYLAGKPPTKAELEEQLAEARVDRSMWKAAAGMFSGALEFMFDQEPEVIYSEATVYSREHGYAGTTDLVVKMRVGKSTRPVVVDFKTSKSIYDETSLQLCAYSRADFVGLNDGTEAKMPKGIRDGIAVRLMASGKYEPVAFTLSDELFDVFLAARNVALGKSVVEGARRPTF